MSNGNWYSSSQGHNNWDYIYSQFFGHQNGRDRAWPQSMQRNLTAQGNSSVPSGWHSFSRYCNQRRNYHQSSFTPYNQRRNNYPGHQRNEPLATIQRSRSNINQHNLSYVGLQERSSNSETRGNSQNSNPQKDPLKKQQQQQNNTKVLITTLPFLQVIATLLEVLPTENDFFEFQIPEDVFKHFRPWTDKSYQVVVRFCRHISGSNQKDYYPSCLQLRVNGLLCPLPGCSTIPRGPAVPVEITDKCNFLRNSNTIVVTTREKLVMFVQVTRKLTHEDLLQKLLAKSSIPPAVTVAKIKEKLQEDMTNGSDITMTSLHFALLCPLGKTKMKFPCRASTCNHLQCFDAAFYLKMNERKPKWICPVCAGSVEYENLQIDDHFKNILEENISSDKILLQVDGSWKPFQPQDSSNSILTLDDTLDCSSYAAVKVSADTTIDLFSEEETSALDYEDDSPALRATNLAPRTSGETGTAAEVVDLSDDDSSGSPSCRGSQLQKSVGHQITSAPSTSLSPNISASKGKIPTPRRSKRIAKSKRKKSSLNKSIDRPPLRMTLRSHTTMKLKKNA